MVNPNLSSGDRAPAFTLTAGDGERFRLTEQRGRWGVIFFYPKDKTATCSGGARDFQERLGEFESLGAFVVGVSPDDPKSHAEFAACECLEFPLLADRTLKTASKYGVWRNKKNGGRDFVGLVRGTFLIDPSGRLAHVWDNVRVKGHAEKVLSALRAEVEA